MNLLINLASPVGVSLALLPEIVLCLAGLVTLLVAAWRNRSARDLRLVGWLAAIGVILAAIPLGWLWINQARPSTIPVNVALDGFRFAASGIILVATLGTILLSMYYLEREDMLWPEYFPLVLFAAAGMLWLAGADDMMVLFLGLEVMSVAVYVLAGFARGNLFSGEAALKYFLIGAFASAFLLYGIALTYGATGTTSMTAAGAALGRGPVSLMATLGLGLFLIGFGFKVAAAPFHMWTPDVYEGAPTPVTGFMATGVKVAAFAGLARVLYVMYGPAAEIWIPIVSGLAVVSMVVGNLIALHQRSLKRMLAYSSVAHAGYLLAALVPGTSNGAAATLTYLLAYGLTSLAAFGLLAALGRNGERDVTFDTVAGLAGRRPWVAAGLGISMLSLFGFPGTLGFIGKWQILLALLGQNHGVVAVVLVLTSLVSAGYYLPVIMAVYMRDPVTESAGSPLPAAAAFTLAVACLLVVGLGFWPSPALDVSLSSAASLFHGTLGGVRAAVP